MLEFIFVCIFICIFVCKPNNLKKLNNFAIKLIIKISCVICNHNGINNKEQQKKYMNNSIQDNIYKHVHNVYTHADGIFHVCLFLIVYFTNLSYVIFGYFSLSKNSDVICDCNNLWIYDFVGIFYGTIYTIKGAHTFAITLKKSKSINNMVNINSSTHFDHVFIPVLLIWGFVILIRMTDKCLSNYVPGHRDIWDLCQGTFYGILSMVVLFGSLELITYIKKYKQDQQYISIETSQIESKLIDNYSVSSENSEEKKSTISV